MPRLPLENVRVIDLTQAVAGPFATMLLADYGAEVIKIESRTRADLARRWRPFAPGKEQDLNGSGLFASLNRNKKSVTINLKHPRGVELVKRLLGRGDVIVENFSARVMAGLGLDWPAIRAANPQIIYVSMSGFGHTGPHRDWPSFNMTIQALSGLSFLTGFPDQGPLVIGNSWADFVGGLQATVAILAALERRARTRQGERLDLSQYEANVTLLGPVLLDYLLNGRVENRRGNRRADIAPHGSYPAKDPDTWCVISVADDAAWARFAEALGAPPWSLDPRFSTGDGRLEHADELDRRIGEWTARRPAREVIEHLQAAGIAAGLLQTEADLACDPQLAQRGFLQEVLHPVLGRIPLPGTPMRLSGTPGSARAPSPRLGAETEAVLSEILGLTSSELADLARSGALT